VNAVTDGRRPSDPRAAATMRRALRRDANISALFIQPQIRNLNKISFPGSARPGHLSFSDVTEARNVREPELTNRRQTNCVQPPEFATVLRLHGAPFCAAFETQFVATALLGFPDSRPFNSPIDNLASTADLIVSETESFMRICLLSSLALFLATNAQSAQPAENQVVAKELQAYYAQGNPPPWNAAVKDLVADKAEQRTASADYLVALLNQSQADELSGKAPWRATPFWGNVSENPARDLRQHIAEKLAEAPASSATLAVLRWYLDHETFAPFQEAVLPVLDRVKGKEAETFCLGLLQPAHENSVVVLAALNQIGKRKVAVPDSVLKALCDHHRPSLRDAARKLNKERGGNDPGPFYPVKAVQRPALAALMTNIGALIDQPAPPDAEFVKVTTKSTFGKETRTSTTVGWLVKNDADSWVVLTPFGYRETFPKERTIKKRHGFEWTAQSKCEKQSVPEEVKRVAALRKNGDPDFGLSERGGLTGQFQGHGASVYEVMLADWLYRAKQFDLSAQILLPALDSVYMDRHLVEMMRHRMGTLVGYRMLVAFAGDRDFAETKRLADLFIQRYPRTGFQNYAAQLSNEMPKRQDDFKKLTLPPPEQWAGLKKKLSRPQQIVYLAERLRLLNCFQMGQPGGYSIREAQYAEPCGLSRDAAWGMGLGKTKVINPYVELVGGNEGDFEDAAKKSFKGLELTVADIPHLAPFLLEDWHILCVSFWRDFSAERDLDTTRPLVADLINSLAKKDICSALEAERMTPVERHKEIQRVIDWARKNARKSEGTLLLEGLEAEWKPGKVPWNWLKSRLSRLVELKEKRALPLLHRHLDDSKSRPDDLPWILSFGRQLDAESFKKKAEELLNDNDLGVQQQAALLLHATGERKRSHEAFARVLEKGDIGFTRELPTSEVLDVLVKEGTPEARQVIGRLTANRRMLDLGDERAQLLRILAAANLPAGYRFYSTLLAIKGKSIPGGSQFAEGAVVGEIIAREIIEEFAPDDPEIVRIKKMFPKPGDQIAPLQEWLKAKAKALETARPK
jgi:hypothetical protein